jgi:2,3-bisphosphoglycerate-independent phosphoglycerate mutase
VPQAAHTAAVVNELSVEMARILEAHPIAAERKAAGLNSANCVLLRGCGSRIQVRVCVEGGGRGEAVGEGHKRVRVYGVRRWVGWGCVPAHIHH